MVLIGFLLLTFIAALFKGLVVMQETEACNVDGCFP
jgi:hypothetical protein